MFVLRDEQLCLGWKQKQTLSTNQSSSSLQTSNYRFYLSSFNSTLDQGFFFARFPGNAKQGFVREFELDHFLSQLDGKKSELGNFYLIFQQFFNKIMAILFENLS